MKTADRLSDESNLTELEIGPDGRVYVFGASSEILELLDKVRFGDNGLGDRLRQIKLAQSAVSLPRAKTQEFGSAK
jgi:hypothetical protein